MKAEEFLKVNGIKDTLYHRMGWVKGGLSKLLNDYTEQKANPLDALLGKASPKADVLLAEDYELLGQCIAQTIEVCNDEIVNGCSKSIYTMRDNLRKLNKKLLASKTA